MKDLNSIRNYLHKIMDSDCPIHEKIKITLNKIKAFNGKLYKYYSFEDEWALKNLQADIIHFSKPQAFNDPFDCALGFSLDKAVEAILPSLIDKNIAVLDNNPDAKKYLEMLLIGENNKSKTKQEKFLDFILNTDCVKNAIKNGGKVDEEKLQADFLKELLEKGDLLKIVEMSSAVPIDINSLSQNALYDLLAQKILSNPKEIISLFDSVDMSEDDKKNLATISDIAAEDGLINKLKKLAKLSGQDTSYFDLEINKAKEKLEIALDSAKDDINNTFAISCFSESPDNILMWSHYGNKHAGFCVEYNFNNCKDWDILIRLLPAVYTAERLSIPKEIIDCSDIKNIKVNTGKDIISEIMLLLLNKSKIWEYEAEWRIIGEQKLLTDGHLKELPIVSKVFLGANISEENKSKIIKIIKSKENVEAYQYTIDDNKYKLNLNKL